ncbi:ribonuclease HI [Candidatus Liberibacter americanus]|uniref:Ribonuclease H n=1 Tax=Candidatus Liberibacter americanus str. Sao Paulo TaxID=1261131 RepID=U6B399_9HYPH|nr:ribonuclease HI [Candidatus Liberibacter americanus]AHA27534.1 Ribonuclease HI [Candidatus Liberibacter americanus str. Sao Paulo]EMS36505.1 Ribonuclease HI [Candidatus Liberibacter americanus PW_SP]
MKKVKAYIDGACSGNPGPGGWAVLLRYEGVEKKISGGEKITTNNRMELMAAISAMKLLKYPCELSLYTDSLYVRNGLSKWIKTWSKNGWRNSKKEPVKNAELWQTLEQYTEQHDVTLHWIKGHSGHKENEIVDKMAREEAIYFKNKI